MKITDNALKVLEKRYLLKDDQGNVIETPEEMLHRVANHVAKARMENPELLDLKVFEEKASKYFHVMDDLDFLPNSPTLMNAGRSLGQLSACFVLPIESNVIQILKMLKYTALIHKSGGGTGFNFTKAIAKSVLGINYKPTFVVYEDHPDAEKIRNLKLENANVEVFKTGDVFPSSYHYVADDMDSLFSFDELLIHPGYLNFSGIRKEGSLIRTTHGKASGPASFMKVWDSVIGFLKKNITPITTIKVFNASTEAVKQGGTRRGANMGIVNVDSYYIREFIDCKKDNSEINNFNLSVGITEKFMSAYLSDENHSYELLDYSAKNGGSYTFKEESANEIMDMIVEGAWLNGEPGLIFLDKINKTNPVKNEEVESTNPCGEQPLLPFESCITGDTLVLTEKGVRTISSLVNNKTDFVLSTDNKMHKYKYAVSKGIKPVYKLTLDNKIYIKATGDHKISIDGNMIDLSNINIGDHIDVSSGFPMTTYDDFDEVYEMYGWMHGDGWYTDNSVGISFNYDDGDISAKDRLLVHFLNEFDAHNRKPLRDDTVSYQLQLETNYAFARCNSLGFVKGRAIDKQLPISFYAWTLREQLSFMKGLFGADGSIQGKAHSQVYLASTSYKLVEQVQHFLSTIGIQSRLFTSEFDSNRNPQHKCCISKESANSFMHVIGMSSDVKSSRFNQSNYVDNNYMTAVSVEYIGDQEVFDIVEVSGTNTFFANGIAVHNCNLGSVNLKNMIKISKDGHVTIDWERLATTVIIAVEFLNDIIDVNKFPIPEIEEKTKKYRKIGLGVMGWADMLCLLRIPYNSSEAIELARKVSRFIQETAWEKSYSMSLKGGPFPGIEETNLNNVANATTTTIAPTGTLSIIAGVSSGIEPLYALAYIRNQADMEMIDCNPLFEEKYRELPQNLVLPFENIIKTIAKTGTVKYITLPTSMAEVFVTAHEISPTWHVLMQNAWQENTDNAVSKTINLKNNATKEDVREAYLLAYGSECKGITIYRDGSRDMQVLNIGEIKGKDTPKTLDDVADMLATEELEVIGHNVTYPEGSGVEVKEQVTIKYNYPDNGKVEANVNGIPAIVKILKSSLTPRPRPEITNGFTKKVKIGCGTIYITVNWDDEGICEIFTNNGRSGGCPSQSEATARLASTLLRCGVNVDVVIEQLKGIRCQSTVGKGLKVLSCPDAIGKVLEQAKAFLERKQEETLYDICDGCGEIKEECVCDPTASDHVDDESPSCIGCGLKDTCNNENCSVSGSVCPDCGAKLEHEGGCNLCRSCGFSKCG